MAYFREVAFSKASLKRRRPLRFFESLLLKTFQEPKIEENKAEVGMAAVRSHETFFDG